MSHPDFYKVITPKAFDIEHVIYENRQVGQVGKNGDAPEDSFILSGPRKINYRRLEEGRIFFFNKNSFFRSPLQRFRGPNLTFGKLPFGKLHIWEVATLEIVTWEVALRKMPLRNNLAQKLIWGGVKKFRASRKYIILPPTPIILNPEAALASEYH